MTIRAVLGIDAAWTATRPSGVALAIEREGRWHLAAVAPSYAQFTATTGHVPDAALLIDAARGLAGVAPSLVAIDMPLARYPITARRAADNAVTRAYGGRHCGTHSPSAERPGSISNDLRRDFAAIGYPLLTDRIDQRGVIEVYPHPALVELMPAPKRLPYKAGKTLTYWPDRDRVARKMLLAETWETIAAMLERELAGAGKAFAGTTSLPLKAREDMLDAMVCCVIGIHALDGRCRPFGDEDAAIWIPLPVPAS